LAAKGKAATVDEDFEKGRAREKRVAPEELVKGFQTESTYSRGQLS